MPTSLAIIVAIAALLTILNRKLLKWPSTIGLMALSLMVSVLVMIIKPLVPGIYEFLCRVIIDADFKTLLMDVMLSFLLFAGAMHVDIRELRKQKWTVILFATTGVLISTFLVGGLLFLVAGLCGVGFTFLQCLLFGALISPTDPIAVISIMTKLGVEKDLLLKVEGESLFNDGIGVIVFLTILSLVTSGDVHVDWAHVGLTFLEEAGGGIALGLGLGWSGFMLMKWTKNDVQSNLMITLAITVSGYALASMVHFSGPLAMVVAGLWIGNQLRATDFPKETEEGLVMIWEMLDEVLNTILFVLIGLTIHTVVFDRNVLLLGILTIGIVLLSRFVSVALPYSLLRTSDEHKFKTIKILTWGGLRGGISIALALSVGNLEVADELLLITYCVVIFSIIVQGLTIGKMVNMD